MKIFFSHLSLPVWSTKVPFQLVSKAIVRVWIWLSVLGKAIIRVRVGGNKPMSVDFLIAIELVL